MTPGTTAILDFDVDEVLRLGREADVKRTPADRKRAADALERARFEAAEFLVDRGNPAERTSLTIWFSSETEKNSWDIYNLGIKIAPRSPYS